MKIYLVLFCFFPFGIAFSQNSNINKTSTSTTKTQNQSFNTPSCEELIYYRDKILAKDFKSAYDKYILSLEMKLDIEKLKVDLLNDKASWYQLLSTKAASSDLTLAFAVFANVWKLLSDKYKFVLSALSGNSLGNTGLEYGSKNQEFLYNILTTGKMLQKAVMEDGEREAYKAALSKSELTKNLNNAIQGAIDFALNINSFTQLKEDHTQLKSEVQRILTMLERAYEKYESNIKSSRDNQNRIREIVVGIDKYWAENCKNKPASKKIVDPKDISQQTLANKPVIQKDKQISNNTFYIFLSTEIKIEPEASQFSNLQSPSSLYIISEPILHAGEVTDQMEDEKEKFKNDMESQLANRPKILKLLQKNKDYQKIDIHFGKPYSRELLKTNSDAFEAIEAYKNSTRELLEGLSKYEFFQLK